MQVLILKKILRNKNFDKLKKLEIIKNSKKVISFL